MQFFLSREVEGLTLRSLGNQHLNARCQVQRKYFYSGDEKVDEWNIISVYSYAPSDFSEGVFYLALHLMIRNE